MTLEKEEERLWNRILGPSILLILQDKSSKVQLRVFSDEETVRSNLLYYLYQSLFNGGGSVKGFLELLKERKIDYETLDTESNTL